MAFGREQQQQVFVPFLPTKCGDAELNPGPPKSARQTKITDITSTRELRSRSSSLDDASNIDESLDLADVIREIRDLKLDLKKQVYDRVDELKEDVTNLRSELKQNFQDCARLAEENRKLKDNVDNLTREVDDIKARMKRDNLIFYNIDQSPNETWQDSEDKVKSFISDQLDMDAEIIEFERVHRLTNARTRPQPLVAKFSRFKQRDQVLQKSRTALKNSQFRVSEDFSPRVRDTRRKLGPFLKQAKDNGKRAFLNYDKLKIDGTVYVFDEASKDIRAVDYNRR
ncbi:uncharacterized protein PF3D7_1120000-like [Ptychodera flava]|uniref:uncharacterized protein PF3D7_1120000-like n=1 Tax=Ptychodera flava TaxID=63121 RepID=UPI00396AA4DC